MTQVVEVLDGIMGSGKTKGICKWIDDLSITQPKSRFFFVSPLLSEIDEDGGRIHKQCKHVKFVSPESKNRSSKSEHLLTLLQEGVNISCTHSLYLNMSEEHFKAMQDVGYILIIDEEIGMISGYNNYSQADCDSLIEEKCVTKQESDGMLVWIKDSPHYNNKEHKYYSFKRHVENGIIYACKASNSMMVTQLPIKLISVAKRVIILTYMFDGNILSSFLTLKGIPYKPFTEVTLDDQPKEQLMSLISLYKPRYFRQVKLLERLPLTYTWYSGNTSNKGKRITKEDCDDIAKYIKGVKNSTKADWDDVLYTFPKVRSILDTTSRQYKINPEGFKRSDTVSDKATWLASNTRATNDLKHKWCLIHCYNRYPTQSVMQYLKDYGVEIDNDVFAVSEMLQWIWRSRIRDGKDINLAILSPRMKLLFLNWLHDLPLDNKDYGLFADYLNEYKGGR